MKNNWLWIDDQRPAPVGYDIVATTARAAIVALCEHDVSMVAFDHDLGPGQTGYDVACLIEDMARDGRRPPVWTCHSSNPGGRKRINAAMQSAHKLYRLYVEAHHAEIFAAGLRSTGGAMGSYAAARRQ